ncbi:acyltransferase [Dactylosporangium sp. NPDC048998]|uniref:acyltransferase family protein n=1 Tax=Dactylosporangium sp. NPDC048998 TaxID=3363976 RepID=UPI0037112AED
MTTERDRALDALRAIAILGVVLGHWLVTALVVDDGGSIRVASPLRAVPWLAPASWLFQTLALFFFVGGLVAARSSIDHYGRWLRARLDRLFRPVVALLAVWTALVTAAAIWHAVAAPPAGAQDAFSVWLSMLTSHTVLKLVASPLWFLLVFAALTAATPLVRRLHPAWPLTVVAAVDLIRFGLAKFDSASPGLNALARFGLAKLDSAHPGLNALAHLDLDHFGPDRLGLDHFELDGAAWVDWVGWVNLAAGWLVPFCLGAAWTRGRFRSRTSAWLMLILGAAATVVLTRWFGYPVSMVGVPGQGVSNLNPPTLAAVTFGIAQCGAALLLMPVLRRVMQRPKPWLTVAIVNLSAMTIFLWHQTSLIAVTLLAPPVQPGLHTTPQDASWLVARLLWLPVFAVTLVICWLLFHRFERRPGLPSSPLSLSRLSLSTAPPATPRGPGRSLDSGSSDTNASACSIAVGDGPHTTTPSTNARSATSLSTGSPC